MFKVAEKFISINGESKLAGQLALFIRFVGCNLECSYCDTAWANQPDVNYTSMTIHEIVNHIIDCDINNITLTGGEPLLQNNIVQLITSILQYNKFAIEIETNGSVPIKNIVDLNNQKVTLTMDYKLNSSLMNEYMLHDNLKLLRPIDTLKFVVGSTDDLEQMKSLINEYDLIAKTNIYISPVHGNIEPDTIVEFMKNNKLNGVTLQLQLHKIIWSPDLRGV